MGCPISSKILFSCAVKGLQEKGAFGSSRQDQIPASVSGLAGLLPENYMPDVYLELSLMNKGFQEIFFVLNGNDRCYLQNTTGEKYFQKLQIPPLTAAADTDAICLVRFAGEDKKPEYEIIQDREELPAWLKDDTAPDKKKREKLICRMRESGCPESALSLLREISGSIRVPYWDKKKGLRMWILCLDPVTFHPVFREDVLTDCHAVIRISDRSHIISGLAFKPSRLVQWHITDECDQRCRHCYLFAEDAGIECVSTPYDQLIRTLDSFTEYAASIHRYPMPVISGGDPLLHPDFWRFAEELHRRGLHWRMMGNPFHLDREVCRRLKALGCYRYQMSLDGLQPYHDAMRRPGSFQATLDAIGLLNDAGIKSQLMATASRQNLEDILVCMDIAVKYRADVFQFARYCATSPEKAAESYPTPEEYRSFLLKYYRKRRKYMEEGCATEFPLKENLFKLLQWELGELQIPPSFAGGTGRIAEGCSLGMGCAILPNGAVMACRRMESVLGNIKTDSFTDIMNGDLRRTYKDITNIKKCRDCELLVLCRGCRAVGFNVTGDLQASDPCCWKNS